MASKTNTKTKKATPIAKPVAAAKTTAPAKPVASPKGASAVKATAAKPVASRANAPAGASASAEPSNGKGSLEARLTRLLRLSGEAEAEKILTALKGHGLTKTQVVSLVEAIHREETEIIFGEKVIKGDLQTNQEDLMDEADLASSDIEQGMKMRMANRENFKVKRLHRTLDKIRDGSYGECQGCGADIGYARLSARTIAELCIGCKEEEERKENHSAVGRKPKSLGHSLGSKLSIR